MHLEFTKKCELIKKNEVVHFFESEQYDKIRITTKSAEDFLKDKKYKVIIEKLED